MTHPKVAVPIHLARCFLKSDRVFTAYKSVTSFSNNIKFDSPAASRCFYSNKIGQRNTNIVGWYSHTNLHSFLFLLETFKWKQFKQWVVKERMFFDTFYAFKSLVLYIYSLVSSENWYKLSNFLNKKIQTSFKIYWNWKNETFLEFEM